VQQYVASRGWTEIAETEWKELRSALPDVSESTVRAAGLSIAQPWLGVLQHSLDELEQSLSELSAVYAARVDLRRYCRDQVIVAKSRARQASQAEMVKWMLVWLDDPSMFNTWVQVRRKTSGLKSAVVVPMSEEHRVKCDVCGGTGRCVECKGTGNGGQCFNCAGTGNCPQCQGSGRREVERVK
jgi:hypothetical protein